MASGSIEGGCLCGGTRYRLLTAPVGVGDCHCIDCRRASGAPYVTWGSVRPDQLEVCKGEPRQVRHADRIRTFAACCGTPLFFAEDDQWIDVAIATLDDPTPFAPEKAIWTEDRLPWVPLDPARPHFVRSSRPDM